jgi:hypothetical protein
MADTSDAAYFAAEFLDNVHPPDACAADRACVIHNPTDHHMREWPLIWREDRGFFERRCAHGIGHPDPDHLEFRPEDSVHGCDGCCMPADVAGRSASEALSERESH